jgi:hypothetical protein
MPRTLDIQRIEQTHNSRPLVSQQELSREAVKQSQAQQEQVLQNKASSEGNYIRGDNETPEQNRERRYRRYGQRKKVDSNPDEVEKAVDTKRGQHIDIKL